MSFLSLNTLNKGQIIQINSHSLNYLKLVININKIIYN